MGAKLITSIKTQPINFMRQLVLYDTHSDTQVVLNKLNENVINLCNGMRTIVGTVSEIIHFIFHELEITEVHENVCFELIGKELESRANNEGMVDLDALLDAVTFRLKSKIDEFAVPLVQQGDGHYQIIEFFK